MKKVSTAVAKQSRNISQQKLTVGLDLGDRNSWYCVMDEAGQIQVEQRVRTNGKGLREVFGGMPRSRVALETGTHSPWISRLLSELGHEVIVAHARKVRLIGESRKKDDRLDAQTLARVARIDPERGFEPPTPWSRNEGCKLDGEVERSSQPLWTQRQDYLFLFSKCSPR